jgi:hypothetical protein
MITMGGVDKRGGGGEEELHRCHRAPIIWVADDPFKCILARARL